MTKRLKAVLIAGAMAAVSLSACAQAGTPSSPQAEAVGLASSPYHMFAHKDGGKRGFPAMLGKSLNLTAEQQTAFKAIAEKYKGNADVAGMKQYHDELKALILAEQVDAAALRAFLDARQAEMSAARPQFTAMLGEFRAVLTDAQRQQLIDALSRAASERQGRERGKSRQGMWNRESIQRMITDRMVGDLNFNTDQRTAVDALVAKVGASRQPRPEGTDMQARKQAFIAFLQTGETSGLSAKATPTWPIDEVIDVATRLDKTQREKLVAKLEQFQSRGARNWGGKGHSGRRHQ